MRKQISFQQNTSQTCLVNIKNIFGFSINYIDDKIKKNSGKWDSKNKKFSVPLTQMFGLVKQLKEIDRSFYIQQVPNIVNEMVNKYGMTGKNKVRKQILVDNSVVIRYDYLYTNVIKNVMGNNPDSNQKGPVQNINSVISNQNNFQSQGSISKHYNKILIVTIQSKIMTWMEHLNMYKCRRLKFQNKQYEICQKQSNIWLCSYQLLWNKAEQISKYCFQTVIVDQAQNLSNKLNTQEQSAILFKRFLLSRHFVFPVLNKMYLNKLEILLPLLSITFNQTNFSWFSRRYRKQNISQLYFLVKSCCLVRQLNSSKNSKSNQKKHFFNKVMCNLSEKTIQKIKNLNRKSNQIDTKKILQNPSIARNKNQRTYLQSIYQILRQQKQQQIQKLISYYCLQLHTKLVIVIQTNQVYRTIENYLCEFQISYCHYEHHQQILEYNKNSSILVCLVKNQYLINVNFCQPLCSKDQTINTKLQNYQPEQYLCLSGVKNVIFPDIQWQNQVRRKEESIRELFRYVHGDLVRHYFILKGTYQQKWMKTLEQTIIKIQMNLKVKQDIIQEENQQNQDLEGHPAFAFCQLNLAQVQEQYSHLKIIKGTTDIDDEFDKLEFQAMQQRIRRQTKKNRKIQKFKQKQMEKLLDKTFIQPQNKKKQQNLGQENKIKTNNIIDDQQQQYEELLKKKQMERLKKANLQQKENQAKQLTIYEPIVPLIKNIDLSVQKQLQNQQQHKKTQNITGIISNNVQSNQLYKIDENKQKQMIDNDNQSLGKQVYDFKQGQTVQVQIIQVRKPPPKPKIPKQKMQTIKVILRPTLIG